MLCPECRCAAPGGTTCSHCGCPVPERETFAGQGGRYLMVLLIFSCLVLLLLLLADYIGFTTTTFRWLYRSGWIWLYVGLVVTPAAVGLYYWVLLREEEVTVTDQYISRRSHWGNEYLPWAQVRRYVHRTLPLRQTRLGRVTWFSRFFRDTHRTARPPRKRSQWILSSYELIGPTNASGHPTVLRLEPGTIDDMDWLLALIEERIGPPQPF